MLVIKELNWIRFTVKSTSISLLFYPFLYSPLFPKSTIFTLRFIVTLDTNNNYYKSNWLPYAVLPAIQRRPPHI